MLYGGKIEFKSPRQESDFKLLQPASRAVLGELSHWLAQRGYRHAVVTDVLRTEDEQVALYGTDRFSWHRFGTAWDLRVKGGGESRYTLEEAQAIVAWLKTNWPDAEVLLHGQPNTTNNCHIHFAIRLRDSKKSN